MLEKSEEDPFKAIEKNKNIQILILLFFRSTEDASAGILQFTNIKLFSGKKKNKIDKKGVFVVTQDGRPKKSNPKLYIFCHFLK